MWKAPDARLLDVTPKDGGEAHILFVPDTYRSYTGEFVDNARRPLRDDARIKDYIAISKHLFNATSTGKPNEPVVVDMDVVEPIAYHHSMLAQMLTRGTRDHDPCFCGSGKKYKKCHVLPRAD